MMNLWEPELHIVRGFCYTFESREVPVFMANDEMLSEKLSNLALELDVSLNISHILLKIKMIN